MKLFDFLVNCVLANLFKLVKLLENKNKNKINIYEVLYT